MMRGTAPFHSTAGEAECWREAIDEICTLDCITKDSKVLFADPRSRSNQSIRQGGDPSPLIDGPTGHVTNPLDKLAKEQKSKKPPLSL